MDRQEGDDRWKRQGNTSGHCTLHDAERWKPTGADRSARGPCRNGTEFDPSDWPGEKKPGPAAPDGRLEAVRPYRQPNGRSTRMNPSQRSRSGQWGRVSHDAGNAASYALSATARARSRSTGGRSRHTETSPPPRDGHLSGGGKPRTGRSWCRRKVASSSCAAVRDMSHSRCRHRRVRRHPAPGGMGDRHFHGPRCREPPASRRGRAMAGRIAGDSAGSGRREGVSRALGHWYRY